MIGLSLDVAFEQFDFGGLGVTVVHHLVEEFVDDDEVVADGFFLDVFEVAFEDADQSVDEGEDHDCVVVFF